MQHVFQAVGFVRAENCPTQAVLPLGRTRGGQSHPRSVYLAFGNERKLPRKQNTPGTAQ
ncbi:MAG: hypothetical protein ACQESR_05910 [Planctomycetota bacterium]